LEIAEGDCLWHFFFALQRRLVLRQGDLQMVSAVFKALGQMTDPAFLRTMIYTFLTAMALLVAVWIGLWQVLSLIPESWISWMGPTLTGYFHEALWVVIALITLIFFPALLVISVAFYLEIIIKAVEDKHYPHLPAAKEQPIRDIVVDTLLFLGLVILANIVVLIFNIFTPVTYVVVAFLVNALLIGGEYYLLVSVRRLKRPEIQPVWRQNYKTIILFGAFFTFVMTIPFVNLAAPILAAATMAHLFLPMADRYHEGQAGKTGQNVTSSTERMSS